MNLIELLRQVKSGDKILRSEGGWIRSIDYYGADSMLSWLAECAQPADLHADNWYIESHSSTDSMGPVAAVGAEPLRMDATAIVDVLRQHFDIAGCHSDLVREMWLAMQLLATPERCADFIRRSLVIGS